MKKVTHIGIQGVTFWVVLKSFEFGPFKEKVRPNGAAFLGLIYVYFSIFKSLVFKCSNLGWSFMF